MTESAHLFPDVHAALGVNLNDPARVMADVQPIPVTNYLASALPNQWGDLYVSRNLPSGSGSTRGR